MINKNTNKVELTPYQKKLMEEFRTTKRLRINIPKGLGKAKFEEF